MSSPENKLQTLRDQGWRYRPDTFAERISDGQWVGYDWVVAIMRHIQRRILEGDAKIIINAPPRHGKSESLSVYLVTWFLDWFPERKVLLASYASDLAATFGLRVRDILQDPTKPCWTTVRKDAKKASDWQLPEGGGMRTAGVGAGVTGRGGHLLLVDDPHKDWEDAASPTMRRRVQNWWDTTMQTRQEPGSSSVIIQTRWHEDDLSGYLLREYPDEWEHINLPAIAEDDDWLGREEGEALCPERFTREALLKIQENMTAQMWNNLFQQKASPEEGALIMRDWIRHWAIPPPAKQVTLSWDMTFKESGTSYVVGSAWWSKGANHYLLDQVRGKWDFVQTQEKVCEFYDDCKARWGVHEVLVEEAANGAAILASLRSVIPGMMPVKTGGQSKIVRATAITPLFRAKQVFIPPKGPNHPWVKEWIEEHVTFPNAANDDQVDSTSQYLNHVVGDSFDVIKHLEAMARF